ncbi:hypothetical protein CXB51_009568 [Gossypium anomalum]|uniref:Uncharacterized protein n=1 Tax=Gossypium anomalum TaxID=47600 RepID=A0A8J6D2E8_9ROSI|nr:hypothetical protein CXB51_009568 [Gossypium anomalum]
MGLQGIWFLWNDDVSVEILLAHPQFIHVLIRSFFSPSTFIYTVVYASPQALKWKPLWDFLNLLAVNIVGPWVLTRFFLVPMFAWNRGNLFKRLDQAICSNL